MPGCGVRASLRAEYARAATFVDQLGTSDLDFASSTIDADSFNHVILEGEVLSAWFAAATSW